MKIRIRASFVMYLFCIGILASWSSCICTLFALLIHECGHYVAGRAVGERISQIEFTPFGGIMYYDQDKAPSKGLRGSWVALAGPMANYAFILLASNAHTFLHAEIIQKLIMSNLAMIFVNLLPALPLDGGQAVFCLGYYFFRVSPLISLLTGFGILIGAALVLLAVYGFFQYGTLNCSLVIIGLYLAKYAQGRQKLLRVENLYAIVHERMRSNDKVRPVRFFDIPPNTPLYALLSFMDDKSTSVFLYSHHAEIRFIGEKQVYQELLQNPHLLFAQLDPTLSR